MGKRVRFFISYVHEDFDSAKQIYDYLLNQGHEPWMDKHNLLPGEKWNNVINGVIDKTDFFISLQSRKAVQKTGTFQKEQRIAIERQSTFPPNKTFIIPVRLDECQIGYEEIKKLQWINMFVLGFEETMDRILRVSGLENNLFEESEKENSEEPKENDPCLINLPDTGEQIIIERKISEDKFFLFFSGKILNDSGRDKLVTVKVTRKVEDNGLLINELSLLIELRKDHSEDNKQFKFLRKVFLPKPLGRFCFGQENDWNYRGRQALLFNQNEGAMNFFQLKKRFPYGVPDRHLGWVIERSLLVLGFIHEQRLILGNISPANLWVIDEDVKEIAHNRVFFDNFSFAFYPQADGNYRFRDDYSAPEITGAIGPHVSSDIYSLGKSLHYIMGGDSNAEFRKFIDNLCQERRENRPFDAWKELENFKIIREKYFTISRPIFFNQKTYEE